MNLRRSLEGRLLKARADAGAAPGTPALVAPSTSPKFGDYQANGIMAAARQLKTAPLALAQKVVSAAELGDVAEKIEVAGPGFINITLKREFLERRLAEAVADERLGVAKPQAAQAVVVDYSGPNLAKEMHVGHLRSTIIGDALVRTLEFMGHNVIRQNHVGDWGTQFGMLTQYMADMGRSSASLSELESFYRQAKERFDRDADFAERSRKAVALLQAGDQELMVAWAVYTRLSLAHCQELYDRLGVLLKEADARGESAYNADLPEVVKDLDKAGLLAESRGAKCVFLDEFKDKSGEILPVIVRKSDGAYLYATTDLAALRYRARKLKADRILYVHDARQTLHFKQVFAVARKAGFVPESVSLEHIGFGTMMGADGRPFKTREGGTVKLMALLDEGEKRAFDLVSEKNPDLPEPRRREIARVVGIGAVKYSDLSQNRTSDYVFSWDKMLSLDGNTAPYMQYAYARICSIFRKGGEPASRDRQGAGMSSVSRDGSTRLTAGRQGAGVLIKDPPERALAVKLLQFPEIVQVVADECLPNLLCGYLFELAGAFMGFYETCPVLQSDEPLKSSRLTICELTARTIRKGLDLLGIETLEQM